MKEIFFSSLYPVAVSAIVIVLYILGRFWLNGKLTRRIKRVKKKEVFEPISGDTPEELDDKEVAALGLDSVEKRFRFIKRIFPLLLAVLWVTLLVTPYLSKLPAIYISLIVAVVSLILGVAIRPFVENIVGGIVITLFQPFRIGDTVLIDDRYGVIEQINLTHSVLRVWNWKRFVIPNSKLLAKEIENFTMHEPLIWTHLKFHVEPEADLDLVEKLAFEASFASEYKVEGEQPTFWVTDLGRDSVQCWLAIWAPNPSDSWELRCDVRRRLHKKLKDNGIAFQNFRHNSKQYMSWKG